MNKKEMEGQRRKEKCDRILKMCLSLIMEKVVDYNVLTVDEKRDILLAITNEAEKMALSLSVLPEGIKYKKL